jgi:ubiquitin C-terminal hydrolase
LLDENNLYDCNYCQKKVRAERGVKFLKLPKLLNVSLQRFNFDYNTMTRQKINDKITFPFILNFNTFIHGYDQIANKIEENTENYFLET